VTSTSGTTAKTASEVGDPTWHRRRDNMWHFYLASPAKPHYAALKDILHAHADDLAGQIDRAAPGWSRNPSRCQSGAR
jgi:hypothetical protein